MADLSILSQSTPNRVVETWHEANYTPRSRLGLSEVGHKCNRYLWYVHHGYPALQPPGRMIRLFRLGEMIEEQVITDLLTAGFRIHSRQKEKMIENDGIQLIGHIDGIIGGLLESSKPHLLEIKSSNSKRFNQLLKLNSYEMWSEKYKAQIHVYMLASKISRCLVWVENKDSSETYAERIKIDKSYALKVLEKTFNAISSVSTPPRACPKQDWFEVKMCKFRKICFAS